jgi:hypothetical protein
MSIALLVFPDRSPDKPREGAECNGCGRCCAAEPCSIAREFLNAPPAPCPAMEFEGGRFWCGMVRNPGRYLGMPESVAAEVVREPFIFLLGIGRGCDSTDVEEARA